VVTQAVCSASGGSSNTNAGIGVVPTVFCEPRRAVRLGRQTGLDPDTAYRFGLEALAEARDQRPGNADGRLHGRQRQ